MGIKEGVKTAYLLVVYILAMMARMIVTCINRTLKNIPHSLEVRAMELIKQNKKLTIPIKEGIKKLVLRKKMKGSLSNSWIPGSRVFQNQKQRKPQLKSSRTHPSGVTKLVLLFLTNSLFNTKNLVFIPN